MIRAESKSGTARRRHVRWLAGPIAALVLLGALGCWTSRPTVVATPEFSSVQVRLDAKATQQLAAMSLPPAVMSLPPAVMSLPPAVKLASSPTVGDDEDAAIDEETWQPIAPPRGWRYIVLHHSGTEHGSVESIDAVHRQRTDEHGQPWLGIGYHFVVGNGEEMPDGEIAPTFRWQQQLAGAHAGSTTYNSLGIGVCVIGDCDAAPPSERQTQSLKRLVGALARRYQIPKSSIVPHSEVKATTCPGRYFPLSDVLASAAESAGDYRTRLPLATPWLALDDEFRFASHFGWLYRADTMQHAHYTP